MTICPDPLIPHPASIPIATLREQCDLRLQRRSGPGGQHRNKVETAVFLLHRPTGVQAAANERRAQGENLKMAVRRLRVRLAVEVRVPWTQPSPCWQRRSQGPRLTVSKNHEEFPQLLAEALDALSETDWQHQPAAQALGCSATQLVRFLRSEPSAIGLLNDKRMAIGLGPLR